MTNALEFAAVEAGGTTFVVGVGVPPNIRERAEFETGDPETTLKNCVEWLRGRKFDALGIASFGPVDLKPSSSTYGYITTTPKPKWHMADVLGAFKEFDVPKKFETDVNGAALGEHQHGNHGAVSSCCYITVGTGIGVGIVVDGQPVHGLLHPEGGHYRPARKDGDTFEGTCPFHKDCVEGLTASGALAKRAGLTAKDLPTLADSHEIWDAVAYYLGHLCATLTLLSSPDVIVISGGIMKRLSLFDKIRAECLKQLNGYISHPKITPEGIDKFIVPSVNGNAAGMVGALELARLAYDESKAKSS